MNSGLQFYDNIPTEQIQQILIKSASDLISLEYPNYQYVASRLLLYSLRKALFGKLWDHPHLFAHTKKCVKLGVYDADIFCLSSSSLMVTYLGVSLPKARP